MADQKGNIVLAHDPDARPIDFLDEDEVFRGLAADYISAIEEKLDFKFNIVHLQPWSEVVAKAQEREIDVLCAFAKNFERVEWMLFTDPYIEIKIVILTRTDFKGTLTLNNMAGMRVSFTKGWVTDDYLRDYAGIELVPAVDEKTAMNYLSTGQVDAWVTALTVASIQIEDNRVTNLRIAGETDLAFGLCIASRKDWPVLNQILKKGLAAIPAKEKAEIFNKWIHIRTENKIDIKIIIGFFVFVGIGLLLIGFILVWNRSLRQQVENRTKVLKTELNERKIAQKALLETKDLLYSIIDNTSGIVYVKDLDGKYLLINSQFETLFQLSREQVLGRRDQEIFPEERASIFINNDLNVVKADRLIEFEDKILLNDGLHFYITVKFPLRDAAGMPIGVCGILTDITEQKHNEKQITASLKEKEVLLREIHHRVKNNLQVTASLLVLQSAKFKEQEDIEIFRDIRNKIGTMSLVHEKLYQSGNLTKINFGEYVRDLAGNLFASYGINSGRILLEAQIKDVFFEVDFATPCGLIISELISNCLKHAFPGEAPGTILISLRKTGHTYELIVSDNGIGLPQNIDFNTTTSFGLNLVRMLVESQLEGKIEQVQAPGTRYRIHFDTPVYSDAGIIEGIKE